MRFASSLGNCKILLDALKGENLQLFAPIGQLVTGIQTRDLGRDNPLVSRHFLHANSDDVLRLIFR